MDFESVLDPLIVVDEWRARAEELGQPLPEAMVLATVDDEGAPHARVVLLKGRRARALHFFTNYHSDKARQLRHQPRVEACVHYPSLALQARIAGVTSLLSAAESDAYFASRPRESQLGAWASEQSQVLVSRATLDQAVVAVSEKYKGQAVPRPPHWGGYQLVADTVELWVGQSGRLHDRARYRFEGEGWRCVRLYP
jgi:pyridoxamine 5'-phosphate oxidase